MNGYENYNENLTYTGTFFSFICKKYAGVWLRKESLIKSIEKYELEWSCKNQLEQDDIWSHC